MAQPRNQTIRFSFRKPETKPPVYLAASFTDPSWHPNEMNHRPVSDGEETEASVELEFYSTYQVPEGDHQYKFRLGDGDWWVCDETSETVLDEAGNRNNLLRVRPEKPLKHNAAAPSTPEKKHAHAKAHISGDASDPNPVWDLLGINPKSVPNRSAPQIHDKNCPLCEFYNPDHHIHLSNAAEACCCGKDVTHAGAGESEKEKSAPGSEFNTEKALQDGEPRPFALRLPSSGAAASPLSEHLLVPAPENTPVVQKSETNSPGSKSDMCGIDSSNPPSILARQDSKASPLNVAKKVLEDQSQSMEIEPTLDYLENISFDLDEPSDTDDPPKRRQLSDADVNLVRENMTHLSPRKNQELVNSAESDQLALLVRDGHSESPRLPHEALASPRAYIPLSSPRTPRDTPKLFPQAHSHIPTIDLYNDPIIPAFPTGDQGLLSRRRAAAKGIERYEDQMGKVEAHQEEPKEEEEDELHSMSYTPTFDHEVPTNYQQIRRQSARHSLSSPVDGASDLPTFRPTLRASASEGNKAGQTHPNDPFYDSLRKSFPDVPHKCTHIQNNENDNDTTHLLKSKGVSSSQTEYLRHRKATAVSTAATRGSSSRGSSCCSWSSDENESAVEKVPVWRRALHILRSWVASLWAVFTRKSIDDGWRGNRYGETVQEHD